MRVASNSCALPACQASLLYTSHAPSETTGGGTKFLSLVHQHGHSVIRRVLVWIVPAQQLLTATSRPPSLRRTGLSKTPTAICAQSERRCRGSPRTRERLDCQRRLVSLEYAAFPLQTPSRSYGGHGGVRRKAIGDIVRHARRNGVMHVIRASIFDIAARAAKSRPGSRA